MVKVAIWGSLRTATEGEAEVEIEARTLGALLEGLAEAYPDIRPQLRRGVSVSIDGRIYTEAWFTPITETSEVVLLPRIVGG